MSVGHVAELWRYPVKSMRGELVDASAIAEKGLVGDRAYALIDVESGNVVSAKNPRRWSVLFECRAAYVGEPADGVVRMVLPDGTSVQSDDARVHDRLSDAVGRQVRLESQPAEGASYEQLHPDIEGLGDDRRGSVTIDPVGIVAPATFFDAAPLHLLTTATLARLREVAPESQFDVRRFRPNVVVAVDDAPGFVENDWVGHTAQLGADVSASVFLAAPRCVMTTLAQDGLPHDNAVLQTIARHNRFDIPGLGPSSCAGVYALVTTGGTVRAHDGVEIE